MPRGHSPASDAGIVVEVLRREEQLEAIEPEWAALAERVGSRAFTRPFWAIPWWHHLGRGRLLVATARESGRLVALAPLYVRRLAGLEEVRFLGHGLGAVSELVVEVGHEAAARQLWRTVLHGRYAQLLEYDERGAGLIELRSVSGANVRVSPRDLCPVVRVKESFDSYWSGRDRELARILRRADRSLAGREYRMELITEPHRLREALPQVVAVHDAADRRHEREHLLAGGWVAFTKALLARAAEVDALRLFIGRVDGRAISFAVTFRETAGLAMWLNRFDPEFKDLAPGHRLLGAMVRHVFDEGLDRLDLLIGDSRYKRLWADEHYETLTVDAASSRARLAIGQRALGTVHRMAHRGAREGRRPVATSS